MNIITDIELHLHLCKTNCPWKCCNPVYIHQATALLGTLVLRIINSSNKRIRIEKNEEYHLLRKMEYWLRWFLVDAFRFYRDIDIANCECRMSLLVQGIGITALKKLPDGWHSNNRSMTWCVLFVVCIRMVDVHVEKKNYCVMR